MKKTASPSYRTDESRWFAVATRDQAADGIFYYGVITTGIFCRPGCTSKLPNRENVVFFHRPETAKKAGYRPCKKCNPAGRRKNEKIEEKIIDACRTIEDSHTVPKLNCLAKAAGLSPSHFHRLFQKIVGVTPKQYASGLRSQRFRQSLRSSGSVTDAIFDAGYSSSSGVYNKNQDTLSMTPKKYLAGGNGLTIHYGFAECFLGWIIVAATNRGICAIEFGDDPEELPQQLQRRFPKATLKKAGAEFTQLIVDVVNFINTPQQNFEIPLDIQGTAFQQQVWSILRQIAPGETMSYSEVAEKAGSPKAVRAVASACASNKLAVVVPCHRVISKSGKIGGYRWGEERKSALLENEGKNN